MDGRVSGGEGNMMPTGIGPDSTDDARVAAIEALLAAGAEVDAQNGDGYTALHLASLAIKPKLVAVLIQGGARVDLATTSHKSATVRSHKDDHLSTRPSVHPSVRPSIGPSPSIRLMFCYRGVVVLALQECAGQFEGKDRESAEECKRLIAAREKELGISATGVGGAGRYTMDVASVSVNGGESLREEHTMPLSRSLCSDTVVKTVGAVL
jgi:hypothetical protein